MDSENLGAVVERLLGVGVQASEVLQRQDAVIETMVRFRLEGDRGSVVAKRGRSFEPGNPAVVINAATLHHEGTTTTLAWDIARVVSEVLTFEREIVLVTEGLPPRVPQDYCLVFAAGFKAD